MEKGAEHILPLSAAGFLHGAEVVLLNVISSANGAKICTLTEAFESTTSVEKELRSVDTYAEQLLEKVKGLFIEYESYTFTILLWGPRTMEVHRRFAGTIAAELAH